RLRVTVDVPPPVRSLHIPPLLVQPLVENAIKHGIAPARAGGEVHITARLEKTSGGTEILCVTVSDTGVGASEIEIARGRRRGGVGLSNVEGRLRNHFGSEGVLAIAAKPGGGASVTIKMPAHPAKIHAPRGGEADGAARAERKNA
ncbi:MAG TPA: ATP-binding protein, partial [Pyrinomonadaceae bacterium]|nr:ATP-binding protein [Pyrinomonadaceae bacterium]